MTRRKVSESYSGVRTLLVLIIHKNFFFLKNFFPEFCEDLQSPI